MVNEQQTLEGILDIQTRIDRLKEELDGLKGEKKNMIRRFNAPLIRRMERTLKRFLANAQEYYGCTEFDISDADIHIETGEYEDCNNCGYEGVLVYRAYGLTLDEQSGKVFVLFSESCGPRYDWGFHREMFSETRLSTIKQIAEYLAEEHGVGLKDAAGKILFSSDQDYYRRRIDLLAETILIPPDTEKISPRAYENFPLLKKVIISDGVTGIGSYAFSGCQALEEIDIPDSVSEIGGNAFEDCKRLKEIRLPFGLSSIGWGSFGNCTRLSTVVLPDGVTEIGRSAFSGCSSLEEIHLPESLTDIGGWAFQGCRSLKGIFIPSLVKIIGSQRQERFLPAYSSAFSGCSKLEEMVVSPDNPSFDSREGSNAIIETASNTLIAGCRNTVIPDSVTRIGPSAFEGCSCPEQLYVPDSVTEIGRDAFKDCSGLRVIYVPGGTDLTDAGLPNGVRVFERAVNPEGNAQIEVQVTGHDGLITMHVPDSSDRIGDGALRHCFGLRGIHIPASMTSIVVTSFGSNAFAHYGYDGGVLKRYGDLVRISVSPNNGTYDSRNDCNAIIETSSDRLVVGCKSTIIPESVSSIGDFAFSGCTGLTEIHIPDSVTSIGDFAFSGCTELIEIHIPDSVTKIGKGAFIDCIGLRNIIIPSSVVEVGDSAFEGCRNLVSLLAPEGLNLKAAKVPRMPGYHILTRYSPNRPLFAVKTAAFPMPCGVSLPVEYCESIDGSITVTNWPAILESASGIGKDEIEGVLEDYPYESIPFLILSVLAVLKGGHDRLPDILPWLGDITDSGLRDELMRVLSPVLDTLRPNERLVIGHFYGIGYPKMTLSAIGTRLGFTKERARQIKEKAYRRIKKSCR